MKNNLAEELLEIKERIDEHKSKLEQLKGQRTATLNQLKEMKLTLPQAEQEQKALQRKIEKTDDELEASLKSFIKTYPELR